MDLEAELMSDESPSFMSLLLDNDHPIQQTPQLESFVGGIHKTPSSFSFSSSSHSPNDLLIQNFPHVDDHHYQPHQPSIEGFLDYSNNPNSFSIEGFSSSSISSQTIQNPYFPVFPQQNNLPFPNPSLIRIGEDEVGNERPSLSAESPKKPPGKGQWTDEEDGRLVQLVGELGVKSWSQVAKKLGGRIGKQCRERWHNHLKPYIKKDAWSEEEDMRLIQAHMELGNKWAQIAEVLPGRTENSIKNHWNATKRRQVNSARRNYRFPEPSAALKNYIDAVTSPSSPSIQSPASSSLATNGGSSIGSPSEEASEAPATGVMNELSEAAEQPFDFGGGSDSGYGAGGFGSDMEIDGFSVADFDYSNLVGMSIDGYNGEVEGDGTVRAGDGGEEVEGMSWQDILNSQV